MNGGPRPVKRTGGTALGDPGLYLSIAAAALMGVAGAFVTVVFVWVLRKIHELLWEELPATLDLDPSRLPVAFIVGVCVVGGLLVGVCRHTMGEYPTSLEQAVDDFRRTRVFDYEHLPQALITSFVSLGFGAALGPEAALVALVGGLSSLVAKQIKANAEHAAAVGYVGIAGGLGALFGPGIAAVPIEEVAEAGGADKRDNRLWLVLPGIAAAAVGWFIFRNVDSTGGYFAFNWPEYEFAPVDLLWAVLVSALAVVAVVIFHAVGTTFDAALERIAHLKILTSALGGLALGLLGAWSSMMLFSGHDSIQTVMDDTTATLGFLLALVLGKIVATNVCLSSGWKGGRFFPIMFVGSALGMVLAEVVGADAVTPAVAAGMSACVAALLRKPIPALVFMLFIMPTFTWPFVIIGCLGAGVAAKRLFERLDLEPGDGDGPDGSGAPAAPGPPADPASA